MRVLKLTISTNVELYLNMFIPIMLIDGIIIHVCYELDCDQYAN